MSSIPDRPAVEPAAIDNAIYALPAHDRCSVSIEEYVKFRRDGYLVVRNLVLFEGPGSYSNGGAMRAAPVGAYFADDLE